MAEPDWDLIVAGGGPAGAATAIRAASLGLRTLVLESARFPRDHVGESLVYLWDAFRLLGVEQELDATFQHKRGSCRVWGRDADLRWTDFESTPGMRNYSLQVERARFDEILLRRAEQVGAEVREGCRVREVVFEGERAVGVRYRTPDGDDREATAGWVVDASGRSGLLARRLDLRRADRYFPDLSVYAYLEGMERFAAERSGNLLIEAIPWGWIWSIPLHTGEVSVGVVCDTDSREQLRRRGLAAFFATALEQSTVIRDLARAARVARGPFATASGGYSSRRYAGAGWLLAGDAAAFVDPMWSTGVSNAITDGLSAAAAVEAVCARRVSEDEAIAYHQRGLCDRSAVTLSLVRFIYRSQRLFADSPFWLARHRPTPGVPNVPEELLLRKLAREPTVRYFRDALLGMGLEDRQLEPLRAQVERERRARQLFGPLLLDLDSWCPRLAEGVEVRMALGPTHDQRLVRGLELERQGVIDFVGDPAAVWMFERIDGRTPAARLVEEAVRHAPEGTRLVKRWELITTLAAGYRRGLIEIELDPTAAKP